MVSVLALGYSCRRNYCRRQKALSLVACDAKGDGMMLPIGPFCPFVSESFINLEESVDVEHTQRMRSIVNRVDQLVQEEMLNPQEHLDLSPR